MQDIQKQLDSLIKTGFDAVEIPEEPSGLYNPVRYTLEMGGKRLRPKLVLLTAGLCGTDPSKALPPAIAVEMLHNFTLVHDDIMDHAETRRGMATVHRKWDQSSAILSGDVLFVLAMKQLVAFDRPGPESDRLKAELTRRFLDAVQTVCDGQALDMAFQKRDRVSVQEYLQMIRAKTAALIQCSMQMGAMVAGSDAKTIKDCGEIGHHAGLAFQIQDDLLDATGDSETFGKKVGGDIVEGKKTCLSILALERADDVDRKLLKQLYGNKTADEGDILRVIRIYHDLGVIDEAIALITEHYNIASQKLEEFENSAYRREINMLLDKLKVRNN